MQFLLILCLLVAGCARGHASQTSTPGLPQSVIERAKLYCDASQPRYKELGYVHSRCDGVGFTSLRSVACGDAELSIFSDPSTGELFRDPSHLCWLSAGNPENGSKSGLSRDMVLMRLYAAVVAKDVAWIDGFIAFAEPKGWRVCEADDPITAISRCQLTPGLIKLIYDAHSSLKGSTLALTQQAALLDDFEDHLRVIGYRVEGLIYGGLTKGDIDDLSAIASREANNALYQAVLHKYTDGNQTSAGVLLDDEAHWPLDRLPTSGEHCENYLYQRAYMKGLEVNPDWLPCPGEGKTHEGTEYSLAVKIIEEED